MLFLLSIIFDTSGLYCLYSIIQPNMERSKNMQFGADVVIYMAKVFNMLIISRPICVSNITKQAL